jgi:2-oxoisovalerate dehydrogenase E1 component
MPKNLPIDPSEVRKAGHVEFTPIPCNQYDRDFSQEIESFGREALLNLYHDMRVIREFEEMLLEVSLRGVYNDIEYRHRGPAHLSIGQEAAAVGQAFDLGVDDLIFGSHRSHGEFLAKGLSAIRKLESQQLLDVMEGHDEGRILRVVENGAAATTDLATEFLVYGAVAEIFHRQTGINAGMGGSMHAFFPPFGIYPNNAIVGASADIATGAALFKRVNVAPGIVICNIGDGATSCGPVWEALCFASMEQFRTLWDEEHRGGLPLIMNFVNNFYAMGGQPLGETSGFRGLVRIGAALNPDQLHAEQIDGCNVLAVIDAVRRKMEVLNRGEGPVLLDTQVYRHSGHSPSDAGSYREKEEIDAWKEVDPISTFARSLIEHDVVGQSDLDQIDDTIASRMRRLYAKAVDLAESPRESLPVRNSRREAAMFSNQRLESLDPARTPELSIPHEDNPRVQQLGRRNRSGIDPDGTMLPSNRAIQVRDAIFEAVLDRFAADPTLVAYGEEQRDWGGAFGVSRGLTESLPYHRLFNSPIAEGAIIGTAIGYALSGGRALVELMYCDFLGRCGDEVFNQLAKWQAMSGGIKRMPVVIRLMVGSMYGAQHSQDFSSICSHIPGLKVVYPATPYDAKGLMNAALTGTDPVLFFESQRLYDMTEQFVPGGVPVDFYEVAIGEPDIKREGDDVTILTAGPTLYRAIEAAEILQQEHDISTEVIDARSLVPFNFEPVLESLKKTGRLILSSDASDRGSIMHSIASRIEQIGFDYLDGPVVVVGARNWIAPAYEGEDDFIPVARDFLDVFHQYILPLDGYTPARACDPEELMRRERGGV